MRYSLSAIQDISLPDSVNEYLNYLSTIRGKSPNTIDAKTLLNAMNKEDKNFERDFCIITLFLNCGLRLSEL